jgi:hypothetical protein
MSLTSYRCSIPQCLPTVYYMQGRGFVKAEPGEARANQPSNKHLAKLTLDLSVQKLTCVHRAQINSE